MIWDDIEVDWDELIASHPVWPYYRHREFTNINFVSGFWIVRRPLDLVDNRTGAREARVDYAVYLDQHFQGFVGSSATQEEAEDFARELPIDEPQQTLMRKAAAENIKERTEPSH